MNRTDLTLIVPTKNEARNIERFLEPIPDDIQLIVVDAGADGTCDIIRRKRRSRTRIVRSGGNIAAARQLAAEEARTEWLLFSDADVFFAHDYFAILNKIQPGARHGGIVGAKSSQGRYRGYFSLFSRWLPLICALGIPAASGSNMLVRRHALMAVGGFDLRLSCNKDSELMWSIRRHGYKVDYEGALKVFEFDHRRPDKGVFSKPHTALPVVPCFTVV